MVDIDQSWGDQWGQGQSGPGDPPQGVGPHSHQVGWKVFGVDLGGCVPTHVCTILSLSHKALVGVGRERDNEHQLLAAGPEPGNSCCLSLCAPQGSHEDHVGLYLRDIPVPVPLYIPGQPPAHALLSRSPGKQR